MGHVDSRNFRRTTRHNGRSMKRLRLALTCLTLVVSLTLVFTTTARVQSGRIKEKNPQRPTPSSGQDAGRTATPDKSKSKTQPEPHKPKTSDEVDEADIVRVSSNLVPIPATVVDAGGNAITGLMLEDFELRVDGQVRPISDMTRTDTSVKLVMLFDNSGSVFLSREFEKRAAKRFFRKVLRPTDEAAIYSIESDSYLAQPLTKDLVRLEYTIDSFGNPSGSTSLFDAIVDAAAYLRPYDGRRVLVIVSDGIETTSRNDFAATLKQVLADDCQIFVVQTGLYDDANLRALAAERRMEQLAGQTGGAVYIPRTTVELELAFQNIAADLAQQYVLSYYPGAERRDGSFHVIDLRVKARKDLRVRARRGYYSPRSASVAASDS
jgi:Ca-activated chloride channel family protein